MTREELARQMNEARDRRLIAAALELAEEVGFTKLSRRLIAERAGLGCSTVSYSRGNMAAFYDSVMGAAVEQRRLRVIAQGLAVGNRIARDAPPELRQAALAAL